MVDDVFNNNIKYHKSNIQFSEKLKIRKEHDWSLILLKSHSNAFIINESNKGKIPQTDAYILNNIANHVIKYCQLPKVSPPPPHWYSMFAKCIILRVLSFYFFLFKILRSKIVKSYRIRKSKLQWNPNSNKMTMK